MKQPISLSHKQTRLSRAENQSEAVLRTSKVMNLRHHERLKQSVFQIPCSVGLLVFALQQLGLFWLIVPLLAVFALKPIFKALGGAAPECSKMIKAWEKTWREILNKK
ncbi:hypothetical protein AAFN60_03265 [Roseibacillus persicicus]|uniref:hypothetical protein n=1 Tax=Roseibacillus persicicus TaxID=454148 RepID=UPI00398AD4BB